MTLMDIFHLTSVRKKAKKGVKICRYLMIILALFAHNCAFFLGVLMRAKYGLFREMRRFRPSTVHATIAWIRTTIFSEVFPYASRTNNRTLKQRKKRFKKVISIFSFIYMVFLWLSLTNVPLARNSEKVAKKHLFSLIPGNC